MRIPYSAIFSRCKIFADWAYVSFAEIILPIDHKCCWPHPFVVPRPDLCNACADKCQAGKTFLKKWIVSATPCSDAHFPISASAVGYTSCLFSRIALGFQEGLASSLADVILVDGTCIARGPRESDSSVSAFVVK